MTNEKTREFTVDLSFLEKGEYAVAIIEDETKADRYGSDYRKVTCIPLHPVCTIA